MNFFQFYDIPISFIPDAKALKRKFYELSRKYHPDFFTDASVEEQAKVLEYSSLNNEAYKTLTDADKRMKYILDLKGILAEEGKNTIPQDFLMEMMDINEALMELEFDFDTNTFEQVKENLNNIDNQLLEEVQSILENYDDKTATAKELNQIKNYYLKKRYLLRIRENLTKFAAL